MRGRNARALLFVANHMSRSVGIATASIIYARLYILERYAMQGGAQYVMGLR